MAPLGPRTNGLKFTKTYLTLWPLLALAVSLGWVAHNIHSNLLDAGVQIDFTVFWSQAGFDVSERLIPYAPSDSYAHVILTGFLNTLLLALTGLIGATCLGVWIGFLSTSHSWSMRMLAIGCVELFRNQPKILILLVLFVLSVSILPPVSAAWTGWGWVLSNRAIVIPTLSGSTVALSTLWISLFGIWIATYGLHRRMTARGYALPSVMIGGAATLAFVVVAIPLLELTVVKPTRMGFDYAGGIRVSTQFVVMWVCLSLYHGAQIGEVVRGGILAVPEGTREAALTLGMTTRQIRRLIVWPQALRLIFPPLCNQYINLFKNTSIAIAVGYSDLMSVTGTMINQTFRPIEAMTVTILLYVSCCLTLAWLLNHINRRLQPGGPS